MTFFYNLPISLVHHSDNVASLLITTQCMLANASDGLSNFLSGVGNKTDIKVNTCSVA